uniref:Uncharacterized protein LOC111103743 n=1 Tax=Crassostrea virginica TaxID=6565 RepID=A0A8B8AMY0_CRAVI|nr:uncharacterized protein LOC111103743 [Crassostrea virginica]
MKVAIQLLSVLLAAFLPQPLCPVHKDSPSSLEMSFWLFLMFMVQPLQGINMQDDETCIESRNTVTTVDQCPQNLSSWIEREKIKNCTSIAHTCSRPPVYHCVINPWQYEMIEVCAPSTKINANYCAEYNTKGGRIQDFSYPNCKSCQSCQNQYESTDAYKYGECYDAVGKNNYNKVTVTHSIDQESKSRSADEPEIYIDLISNEDERNNKDQMSVGTSLLKNDIQKK